MPTVLGSRLPVLAAERQEGVRFFLQAVDHQVEEQRKTGLIPESLSQCPDGEEEIATQASQAWGYMGITLMIL